MYYRPKKSMGIFDIFKRGYNVLIVSYCSHTKWDAPPKLRHRGGNILFFRKPIWNPCI